MYFFFKAYTLYVFQFPPENPKETEENPGQFAPLPAT